MYGLVNQGVHDLAVQLGGEPLWREIKATAGVTDEAFLSMDTYDDDVTYRLVGAASAVLGMTSEDVLIAFGRHWILYTARRGYGSMFDMMGHSLPQFLGNLDAMHARLSLSMPDLRPPSIVCRPEAPDRMRLEYWSDRDGLAPMVVGLLYGLAELFDLDLSVDHDVVKTGSGGHDEFLVQYTPRTAAPTVPDAAAGAHV